MRSTLGARHDNGGTIGKPSEFMIDVTYRLVLTKNADDADIALTTGSQGASTQVVEVPKDPGRTHPFRGRDALEAINKLLSEKRYATTRPPGTYGRNRRKYTFPKLIHEAHILRMCKAHGIKKQPDMFYQGTVKGSPTQYSQRFVDWLVREIEKNPERFQLQPPARNVQVKIGKLPTSRAERVPAK